MDGWTPTSKEIGRRCAEEILTSLVDLRSSADDVEDEGADAANCRLLIENAAQVEALGTVAALSTLAESLLHRLAEATERTEREALDALLSETKMTTKPAAPAAKRRRG